MGRTFTIPDLHPKFTCTNLTHQILEFRVNEFAHLWFKPTGETSYYKNLVHKNSNYLVQKCFVRWILYFQVNILQQGWPNCRWRAACGSSNLRLQLFELSENSYIFVLQSVEILLSGAVVACLQ